MSDLGTFYLTAESFRKLVNVFDNTRVLVGSGFTLNVILQFLCKLRGRRVAFCENYGSLYDLTSYGIGRAGYGRLNYCWMSEQCAFYLERSDTVSGAFDNVVVSAYEPVVSIRIAPRNVAGIIVSTAKYSLGQLRIFVIFAECRPGGEGGYYKAERAFRLNPA